MSVLLIVCTIILLNSKNVRAEVRKVRADVRKVRADKIIYLCQLHPFFSVVDDVVFVFVVKR